MELLEKIAIGGVIGLGAYILGQYAVFRAIDAVDYWDARGYVNGLVKGAGNSTAAMSALTAWKNYWIQRKSYMAFVINPLYNYGLQRIKEIYG